jgi:hypothetical protein
VYLVQLFYPIVFQLRTLCEVTRAKVLPAPLQRIEVSHFPLVLVALIFLLEIVGCAVEEWCLRVLPR